MTLVFAALGTAGALVIGLPGGLVLSDAAWDWRPPPLVRVLRLLLRGVLVAARSIHELVWALLFVSVLGLDPLVAVLAIAIPFGAQTAKVFLWIDWRSWKRRASALGEDRNGYMNIAAASIASEQRRAFALGEGAIQAGTESCATRMTTPAPRVVA